MQILHIVLFSIFFTINIAVYFVYCKYANSNKEMFLNMITSIKQKIIIDINGESKTNKY